MGNMRSRRRRPGGPGHRLTLRSSHPAPSTGLSPWLSLPRVRSAGDSSSPLARAGALLIVAGLGAALVHVVEYHVGLGDVAGRPASIGFMLAHCPIRGGLLIVLAIAALTLLALCGELRALMRRRRRLMDEARSLRVAPPSPSTCAPLRPGRLLALFLPLLLCQAGLYDLVAHWLPMAISMRMHGVVMAMPVQGALPLLPVHLAVAAMLAALIWRLERRFVALQTAITALRKLLRQALLAVRTVPLPPAPSVAPIFSFCGPGALSRPPPV
jgi:hypothetical protein